MLCTQFAALHALLCTQFAALHLTAHDQYRC